MTIPDEQRKHLENLVAKADPEAIAKYGNPLDPNDPRHWMPTTRGERGISVSDRVRLLELDMEVNQIAMGRIMDHIARQQEEALLEELKTNPRAAVQKLADILGEEIPPDIKAMLDGSFGPDGKQGPLFAGSVKGAAADALVVTPQGTIRVDQIPGYRNDPEWTPSSDWVEMNCMCEGHISAREHNAIDNRFDFLRDDDGRGGMYP